MARYVLHNYLPSMKRSVGVFRATATLDHSGEACHCGGSCDACKTHGHDEAGSKVDSYLRQVCSALNNYGNHVQRLATQQFQEGASVQEAVKHIRRSAGAFDSRDGYAKAELGIDVTYLKGGFGRPRVTEQRHYTVPDVLVDPRGYPPQPAFVVGQLRGLSDHRSMIKDGWTTEKIEGYYKREQRDVGKML